MPAGEGHMTRGDGDIPSSLMARRKYAWSLSTGPLAVISEECDAEMLSLNHYVRPR